MDRVVKSTSLGRWSAIREASSPKLMVGSTGMRNCPSGLENRSNMVEQEMALWRFCRLYREGKLRCDGGRERRVTQRSYGVGEDVGIYSMAAP
jgi:hypothetical protein